MYRTRFSSEFEYFGRDFFGAKRVIEQANTKKEFARRYTPPEEVKILPCHQDINGEWVPSLEEKSLNNLEKKTLSE